MSGKKNNFFCFLAILLFCANTIYAQSANSVDAQARDALRRLDDAIAGKPTSADLPAPASAPPSQVQPTRGGKEPSWVIDPYAAYPRDRYLAAVGFASNRAEAENKAKAALSAIFGQSIQSDLSIATTYSEAVSKGIVSSAENTNVRDVTSIRTSLDTLIGAEIGNIWDNAKGTVYTIAYLEKERAIAVYGQMISTNLKNIEKLTAMTAAEKNTFDGYARYRLAAILSAINAKYAQIIAQCGGPAAAALNLPGADAINIEANNIIKNITVNVNVKGDRNNRIRDAFTKVLSGEGLRTRGNAPPYTLEVNVGMSEVTFPNNTNKFCSFTVSAELIENSTDSVLLPFNITDREGHLTYEQAQNRAIMQAEKQIGEKYPEIFKEYLDSLLPKK
jgi:hypothetical protein